MKRLSWLGSLAAAICSLFLLTLLLQVAAMNGSNRPLLPPVVLFCRHVERFQPRASAKPFWLIHSSQLMRTRWTMR